MSFLWNIMHLIDTKEKIEIGNQKISGLYVLREFFRYFKEFLTFGKKGPHTVGRLVLIKKKPL